MNYKVSTFYGGSGTDWFGVTTSFWSTGPGSAGITAGPLSVPDNAAASPGQNSWNAGITWTYPATSSSPENDWVDVEVTAAGPVSHDATAALTVTPVFSAAGVRASRSVTATAALTVTPVFSAAHVQAHIRSAALTVTPEFSAHPKGGQSRGGGTLITFIRPLGVC